MYKNILVPIAADHDIDSAAALDVARSLRAEGGKITALTVVEMIPSYVEQYLPADHLDRTKGEVLTQIKSELGGVTDVEVEVIGGHSGSTILDYANANDNDLVVISSHRPGLAHFFLGSTAAHVVRHATCAVHVVR